MTRRLTNLLLLGLVVAQVATGVLGWALPEPSALPLYDLHRALGVMLVLTLVWKYGIVAASLGRRVARRRRWDRSVLLGAAAGLVLLASLALGLAWTLGWIPSGAFWGYSPLNLHVQLALAMLPFFVWHLLRRWERCPAVAHLASRRNALRVIGLSVATALSWQLVERAAQVWAAPGSRRDSGSRHAGSFSGNDYPVTIWMFDAVPALDPRTWRLRIEGKVTAPAELTYAELLAFPDREVQAVLDCTGGWWSEQVWRGAWLGDVLDAVGVGPGASRVLVVAVTGHRWLFPLDELREALLATHVGDGVLSSAHGFPVRLVAPRRRGFQWVKWVERLEVV